VQSPIFGSFVVAQSTEEKARKLSYWQLQTTLSLPKEQLTFAHVAKQ